MINQELVAIESTDSPGITLRVCTREQGEAWVPGGRSGTFFLKPVPSCRCCGQPAWDNLRCSRHQDRNPCAVLGCTRTSKLPSSGRLSDDNSICGEHWRRFVPPRSPERLAYHRFWRIAKKQGGWDYALIMRFERFWTALVQRVRRRAEGGHLDQREIERMFGWDNAG